MRKRSLRGTPEQHERELITQRRAIASFTKMVENALDNGDCDRASDARTQALYSIGAGHVHHDASTNMLGQGAFREYAEPKAFYTVNDRFKKMCLLKRARR